PHGVVGDGGQRVSERGERALSLARRRRLRSFSHGRPRAADSTRTARIASGARAWHGGRVSTATTEGIRVTVQAMYVPEQSAPRMHRYVFAYTVRIANEGDAPAQLKNRHWIITDGDGKVEEVRGPGVVGQQPTLRPGEQFEYT